MAFSVNLYRHTFPSVVVVVADSQNQVFINIIPLNGSRWNGDHQMQSERKIRACVANDMASIDRSDGVEWSSFN